jgi:glycosyltransferase involved in cell wall biosynthesis
MKTQRSESVILFTSGSATLEQITPVLLTCNEAANIQRTLSCLGWAREIVVVDSGSTDATLQILKLFPKVRVFHRAFDTHAGQWRFATAETDIATEWILRLDADYQITADLVAEIARLDLAAPVAAYQVPFGYAIFGRRLLSSLYPPNTILLRRGHFTVHDHGHTEVWNIAGPVRPIGTRAVHDDRKPVEAWLTAQGRYMRREVARANQDTAGWKDRVRRAPPVMPIAVFVYCLVVKGLIFNGRAGLFYALQRAVAEAILSMMVLEEKFRQSAESQAETRLVIVHTLGAGNRA